MMASILVVDDDADARDALCRFLQHVGYKVQSAGNGREALNSVLENAPDLIVLDWRMPEMDGGALMEVLRGYLRLQAVPVIVWTAVDNQALMDKAQQLNASAVMIKVKTSVEQIRQAIDKELNRQTN
jgi:CheY-like chemotaxis protein